MYRQEYEADLNFSLMPAIEALLKPDEDDAPRAKKPPTIYRRRNHGNQDVCFACSAPGELICCDTCPASFHLECHDPPLSEGDVPQGHWLCRSCKMSKKKKLIKSGSVDTRMELLSSSTEGRSSRSSTPVDPQEHLLYALGIGRKISSKRCNSETPAQRLSLSVEPKTSVDSLISPWDKLVQIASRCNPRKFELPKEMCVYQLFPGDEKGESRSGKNNKGRNGNGSSSASTNGSNGRSKEATNPSAAPLPAKTCFSCRKSCKKAPLINCDFCPLYFHQDCLDPPMTALPTTIWMCPVHPHKFTDWKNISSMAATERVKLWSKFNPTVDQDTVKAQFLSRVHSDRLKTRFKLKPRVRDRSEIPPMVQYHYKNPTPLLVSMKTRHRIREVEEKERIRDGPEHSPAIVVEEENAANEDLEMIKLINEDIDGLTEAHDLVEGRPGKQEKEEIPPPPVAHSGQLRESKLLQDMQDKVKNHESLTEILKVCEKEGKLEDLLKEIQRSVKGDVKDEQKPSTATENIPPMLQRRCHAKRSIPNERIQSRAVLTPIIGNPLEAIPPRPILELSVQMRYRKLTIGTSRSSDLQLDGRCPQQSEKHAIIFYDEFTRTFELLNYSEHGTEVNGQLYSLNFGSRKEVVKKRAPRVDVREKIIEMIDKKRGIKRMKYGSLDKGTEMAAPELEDTSLCDCASRPPLTEGWEGSAVLNHGYLLNFGCESFVFSLPDPFEVDEEC